MGIKQIKIQRETGETVVIERSAVGFRIYMEGQHPPPIVLTWEEARLFFDIYSDIKETE